MSTMTDRTSTSNPYPLRPEPERRPPWNPPRRRRAPVVWLAVGALALLALLAGLGTAGVGPLQPLLDPSYQAKQVALEYATSAARHDYANAWTLYSPCFKQVNPQGTWVALKQREDQDNGARQVPMDARITVVGVRADGPIVRVEVRGQAAGQTLFDYEIDTRGDHIEDTGTIGHPATHCGGGSG